jgi:hypothetical protein
MISEFLVYLQLGFCHIADINGYDHILFIAALCALYGFNEWKQLAWLITAFTLGHSVTLALSSLAIINAPENLIEVLIPLTILITCIVNLFPKGENDSWRFKAFRYSIALVFGLVHGLGFSYYLRSLLGKDENIFIQLFAFNTGLEFGQILIVFFVLLLAFVVTKFFHLSRRSWSFLLSGVAAVLSIKLII